MICVEKAEKVREFIQRFCIQSKAPWTGKPVKLLPWQWDEVIVPIYANLDPQGNRQINKAGIWIPKKQGKSTLCSCLSLYGLLEQPGSECYVIAGSVEQAQCVFSEAAAMVESSKQLSKRLWVRRNIKTIEDGKGKSILKILSSEKDKAGKNANLIICDELASWGASARDVWDELVYAGAARTNRLLITISTAQYDKSHIGYEQYRYAKQWKANPDIDPHFHGVIYEIEEHEDWKDPANWWRANPSADVTVPKQFYHDEFKALQSNPLAEAGFRTRLCNQWVGHSQQWIASNLWADCGEHFVERAFYGQPVIVGLDYARKHDLCSYVLLARKDDLTYLMPRFFIPEAGARRKEQFDKVPYTRWAEMPNTNLVLTSGDTIDPRVLINRLIDDSKLFRFGEFRFDPNGFELVRQELELTHGFDMVEVPPTFRYMSAPTAEFERRVMARKIRHPCNPILDWNLGNCAVRESNDQIIVAKSANANRIDGITASIIALSGLMGEAKPRQIYDRDLIVFA